MGCPTAEPENERVMLFGTAEGDAVTRGAEVTGDGEGTRAGVENRGFVVRTLGFAVTGAERRGTAGVPPGRER